MFFCLLEQKGTNSSTDKNIQQGVNPAELNFEFYIVVEAVNLYLVNGVNDDDNVSLMAR